MGLSHSWIAVEVGRRASVLQALELTETGEEADLSSRFAAGELASGWLVIRSSDFDFAGPKRLALASAGGRAIGGQVEEHVMTSLLRGYEDGAESWWVAHDPQDGIFDLKFGGAPPARLTDIRDRLVREQQSEGGEEADVDMIFEVPVQLGVALCGYRVDGGEGLETPDFVELRGPRRPGLLARLFDRS